VLFQHDVHEHFGWLIEFLFPQLLHLFTLTDSLSEQLFQLEDSHLGGNGLGQTNPDAHQLVVEKLTGFDESHAHLAFVFLDDLAYLCYLLLIQLNHSRHE